MRVGYPSGRVAELIHDGMMHAHSGRADRAEATFGAADHLALEAEHRLTTELRTLSRLREEIARHRSGLREGAR